MTDRTAPARRGRPRTEGVRAKVIQALVGLVAEQGYSGTSMDEVAERAGVSKATIYRRWPSKDALIIDAHRSMLDEGDAPDTGTLEGDLLALVERVADVMEDARFARMLQASAGEMLTNRELGEVFRATVLTPRLEMIHTLFERGIARAEVRPEADWRTMAYALIGSNIFRVTFLGEPPDREANRALVRMIVRDVREAHEVHEEPCG